MSRQFVVQLDNRPGELARLARALAVRGVDIRHVASIGAGPFGCAFLTTSDEVATREVLGGLGHDFIEGDPVRVDALDRPGGLADVLEQVGAAGVNVLGTMIVGRTSGTVQVVMCVDDPERARVALGQTTDENVGIG